MTARRPTAPAGAGEATPAAELRAAAARLRGDRGGSITTNITVEYPDLDAAYAALLESHALKFEHAPEAVTDEGRRALAVARQILGGQS